MDGRDIFRKLSFGTRFDLKRFQADAEKLKVSVSLPSVSDIMQRSAMIIAED